MIYSAYVDEYQSWRDKPVKAVPDYSTSKSPFMVRSVHQTPHCRTFTYPRADAPGDLDVEDLRVGDYFFLSYEDRPGGEWYQFTAHRMWTLVRTGCSQCPPDAAVDRLRNGTPQPLDSVVIGRTKVTVLSDGTLEYEDVA